MSDLLRTLPLQPLPRVQRLKHILATLAAVVHAAMAPAFGAFAKRKSHEPEVDFEQCG
ncbi:hypothetical protein [Desulfovibrio sp. MES5]|uniref:hypothetical protein n=1 Tax=Desulfovibrio sp. MES5 TaxID=1899016 RepID=UPI0025C55FE0|nr:hypothetical protein [Desulfovibrio sp. MES5]